MQKPKILLIHGWLHSRARYGPLADALADSYRVSLASLPGYDDKAYVRAGGGHLNLYARHLAKTIAAEAPAVAVGFSMGGQILLRALTRYPLALPWAVFSNVPYPALTFGQLLARRRRLLRLGLRLAQTAPEALAKPVVNRCAAYTVYRPDCIDDLFYRDVCGVNAAVAARSAREMAKGMPRVKPLAATASLVTTCSHDRLAPPAAARCLAGDLRAPLVNFPAAGHTVVLEALEDYAAFLRLLAGHLPDPSS
ncbi:alpha/beta fold hydrolase [Peptococcus niger]|uniref:Pimeloyl-ACP methyl ester carboxylesterase n=1 Tax=Peptococcus niger TaxID=2741 RepID=A0A1G6Z464_PEPNI|nr:alpha/beta hydrolase [Peptococcus niger]SDD96747.1 Pimeloyl-ACP methyl ester carboxylesterase [Peptococcus niger]